ncbi:MAG: hypothetical protein R3266_10235, partial [Gemmatimonadota bacterium]|nr:hypothetical protein [Gemmatimonadota bacterium]
MIRWRRTEACIAAAFCLALSSSGGHAELAAQTTSTTVRVVEVDPAGDSIGVVADAEVCVSAIGDPRLYYARTDGAGRAVVSDHPATGLRAVISRRGYTSHAVGPVDVGTVPVTRRFEMRRLEPGEEDLLPVPTCSSSPRITSIEVNSGAPTTFSTTVQLDWTTNATFEQPVEYCASVEADGCEPGDPSHWTGLPLATGWSCASPPTMMVSDPDGFCPGYSTTATLDEKVLGDQIVYLSMRYAGGGGQPTLARAGIERLPRAPTLVAFQIDGGAIAAVGTDVRLGWLMEPTPVEAALQFCAIEEQRDCLDAEWQPAPAPGSSPGLGPAYTVDRDLSGAPGTRRVHLQTRYADYPDAVSNRLSDGIVLVSEERTLPGPVRFEEYAL